jgi:GNAT superfamily N-acetyltransferase
VSKITVRQAVLADIDDLTELFDLYRIFYGQDSNKSAVRQFLLERINYGQSVLFLALDESQKAVGLCQLYPSFSSTLLARVFILNDLFVRPEHRQQGAAKGLMSAAIEYGKAHGCVRLTLSTARSNEIAQATYHTLGWVRDEKFYVYNFLP